MNTFKIAVDDNLGKDSYFEIKAENISEARRIARNLHIKEFYENYSPELMRRLNLDIRTEVL